MLSEAKHLGGEWNQRPFLCLAQILRWRSELALSVAEGMTGGTTRTPQNVVAHGADRGAFEIEIRAGAGYTGDLPEQAGSKES